jgi:hypothetical protein
MIQEVTAPTTIPVSLDQIDRPLHHHNSMHAAMRSGDPSLNALGDYATVGRDTRVQVCTQNRTRCHCNEMMRLIVFFNFRFRC